ncbi:MAG: hypothetical protein M1820_008731 [Bogoriella megaspora]|nr:MAG: hypothetical protein M1820_008731 [Bogoriella megaspora]
MPIPFFSRTARRSFQGLPAIFASKFVSIRTKIRRNEENESVIHQTMLPSGAPTATNPSYGITTLSNSCVHVPNNLVLGPSAWSSSSISSEESLIRVNSKLNRPFFDVRREPCYYEKFYGEALPDPDPGDGRYGNTSVSLLPSIENAFAENPHELQELTVIDSSRSLYDISVQGIGSQFPAPVPAKAGLETIRDHATGMNGPSDETTEISFDELSDEITEFSFDDSQSHRNTCDSPASGSSDQRPRQGDAVPDEINLLRHRLLLADLPLSRLSTPTQPLRHDSCITGPCQAMRNVKWGSFGTLYDVTSSIDRSCEILSSPSLLDEDFVAVEMA